MSTRWPRMARDQNRLFTVAWGIAEFPACPGIPGATPSSDLVLSSNALYGTTSKGGSAANGTIFSISLPPELTITPAEGNVLLSWPTNFTGFTLQSTADLTPPAVWTANSALLVVVNGQNMVTNPISGTHQFYRLAQKRKRGRLDSASLPRVSRL